jgi:uncharacterized membrane protein
MFAWLFAVGRMLGFGTAGGLRPALTLAVISVMSLFRVPYVPKVAAPLGFLDRWYVVLVLIVLAILESKFDNVPRLDRIQDRLLLPWRIVGGALAGAATIHLGAAGLIVGLVLGAFAGWLGQAVKHGSRSPTPSSGLGVTLVSLSEEMLAIGAVVATALFAPLGYLVFGFAAWLMLRLRLRRRRKYRVAPPDPANGVAAGDAPGEVPAGGVRANEAPASGSPGKDAPKEDAPAGVAPPSADGLGGAEGKMSPAGAQGPPAQKVPDEQTRS